MERDEHAGHGVDASGSEPDATPGERGGHPPVTRLTNNDPGGRGMVLGGLGLLALIVVGLSCLGTLLARYVLPG